jgi:hypothetical protein
MINAGMIIKYKNKKRKNNKTATPSEFKLLNEIFFLKLILLPTLFFNKVN